MPNHIFKITTAPASDTISGSVKLSDAIDSEFDVTSGMAATPYAAKKAYDRALKTDESIQNINSSIFIINATISGVNASINKLKDGKFDKTGGTIAGHTTIAGDLTVEGTINATIAGATENAVQAIKDGDGNVITDTYVTKTELTSLNTQSQLHEVAITGSYNDLEDVPAVYTTAEIDDKLFNKVDSRDILENGIIRSSILPSYVDDVIEVTLFEDLPSIGESGKIYIVTDTNKQYRWSGTTYIEMPKSIDFGTVSGTAYEGSSGKQLEDTVSKLTASLPNTYASKDRLTQFESSINTSISNINETLNQLTIGQPITTVINVTDGVIPVNSSTIFTTTIVDDTVFVFDTPLSQYKEFYLYMTNGGSFSVTFPENVKWNHATYPSFSENSIDVIKFVTLDTGTTWLSTQIDTNL